MKKTTIKDARRWGAIDGELYAIRWLELHPGIEARKDKIHPGSHTQLNQTDSDAHSLGRDRGISPGAPRQAYVRAFADRVHNEITAELKSGARAVR